MISSLLTNIITILIRIFFWVVLILRGRFERFSQFQVIGCLKTRADRVIHGAR